ncbi:HNH endonuclease family protein [Gordonia sp. SL306]|uniref:HNH endonuclease family protein n=1 Tax=Gordonia sp. SL306 TaxID=2995145 RepID=UPI00226D95AB|nr:HNH endonuclease family protein [Gordonia sp. SL306]WAC56019.1 HNH endonuclease family protein [Gordonia sp. SL306]
MTFLGEWPLRWWLILCGCVLSALIVAVGTVAQSDRSTSDPAVREHADRALRALSAVSALAQRPSRGDYQREAFGSAWTDATAAAGGFNGCDTRNDVLARDLTDTRRAAVSSCPRAVVAGEFRSPYTGEFIVFRRDRRAGAVQIDHIVPLAYAWDMGAWSWSPTARVNLANDPANLVAVDAVSNQTKSDQEPGRWMPPNRGFRCQYSIQFVTIMSTYHLLLDAPSATELRKALRQC